MIRVLHVIGAMNMGGAETLIMNLYRNIDREKMQFDFLVHTKEKCIYDDEIKLLGGKIYSVPKFNGLNYVEYIRAICNFFKQHPEYRIVHGHIGSSAGLYLGIAKSFGCITIAHSHNMFNQNVNIYNLIWKIYSYPTRYIADYYFGCSKGALVDRFGNYIANSQKALVINNGIDVEKYIYDKVIREKIRQSLNIPLDAFVVGHIGRMAPQKNHKFLVKIFAEINKIDSNAVLLLVGDGEEKENVKQLVDKLELSNSVIFAGVCKNVPELLCAMDVFLFPSNYEGLGIATIESQASGLITICSDVLPNETKITDLIHYLSLDKAPKYWAQEVLKICKDYVRCDKSLEIVQNNFDIKSIASELQSIYEEMNENDLLSF